MKSSERRKEKTALTFLLVGFIFIILLAVIVVASVTLLILFNTGVAEELMKNTINRSLALFLVILGSLVVSAVISFIISGIIINPLTRIVNAMNEVASGNFETRLSFGKHLSKHVTVKNFRDSFNTMAEELSHIEMLRSDFINNFSHEFKTPIVSIAGFAKLLKRGNLTDEQKAEYAGIIEEESLRLSEMATNVLNLTKIESQTILTDITEFNISEQIRGCLLLLEDKWTTKGLDVNLELGEISISANEELLRQVWINLIDNAIKFSDEKGTIGIIASETDESVTVSVSNTGCRIPPEERDRIFTKFYQIDKSHSAGGNVIGLPVVKQIVLLHNGDISVSENSGMTVFSVSLPKYQL